MANPAAPATPTRVSIYGARVGGVFGDSSGFDIRNPTSFKLRDTSSRAAPTGRSNALYSKRLLEQPPKAEAEKKPHDD